jgi:hypothetical protein
MKLSVLIKPILALSATFIASTTLASAYTSYSPIVNSKYLSIIITVAILLGVVAMYQKKTALKFVFKITTKEQPFYSLK